MVECNVVFQYLSDLINESLTHRVVSDNFVGTKMPDPIMNIIKFLDFRVKI